MTAEALNSGSLSAAQWRQDIFAGLVVGIIALPVCLAAGVLVFSDLGADYVAEGAAAGLYGAIVAGMIAAAFATSSFVITCPRSSPSLVLASLMAALLINPAFYGNPRLVIGAAALSAFLAGIWQILFGLFRVSDIIKFTPHPVFAGFVNGAALLILKAQIVPFFVDATRSALALPKHPFMLVFVLALALIGIFYQHILKLLSFPSWMSRVPGTIRLCVGILIYHLAKWVEPALDLGPTIGRPAVGFNSPLLDAVTPSNAAQLWTIGGNILLISLVLALVASLESLMAFRAAQRIADIEIHPVRDLAAQGIGNCAAAFFAPVVSGATPSLLDAAYRAGGRTRLSGIVAAAIILIFGIGLSGALAAIPNAALSAVLVTLGAAMFDKWSVFVGQVVRRSSPLGVRRSINDLAVVVVVMAATAMTTIVVGVIAGCLLSA